MNTFPVRANGSMFKGLPSVVDRHAKRGEAQKAWRECCRIVDARDKQICQVTGKRLSAQASDPALMLARHHLEPRSRNKDRRHEPANVWTLSWLVHELVHAGGLWILDKRGELAKSVPEIARVEWNRNMVQIGKEPFRLAARGGFYTSDAHGTRRKK